MAGQALWTDALMILNAVVSSGLLHATHRAALFSVTWTRRDESHDFPDGLLGIFRYERHQVGELQALAVGGEKEEGGRVEEDDYAEDHDEDQEADWKVLRDVLAEN